MTPAYMNDEGGRPVLIDRDTGMPISAPEGQSRVVGTNSRLVSEGNLVTQAMNPRTGKLEDLYRIPGQTDTYFADQLGDLVNNGGAELDVNDPNQKGAGGWISKNGGEALTALAMGAVGGAGLWAPGALGGAAGAGGLSSLAGDAAFQSALAGEMGINGGFTAGQLATLGGLGGGAGAVTGSLATDPAFQSALASESGINTGGSASFLSGGGTAGAAVASDNGAAAADSAQFGVPGAEVGIPGAAAATTGATSLTKILGQVAPGLIDAYGASQKAGTMNDIANNALALGAPSRARYEASMQPGFDPYTSIAGYKGAVDTASESLLRKLSATGGNPYGNPGGMIEANKAVINGTAMPAINEYQRLNAGSGGLAALSASYPQAASSAATADSGIYTGFGNALGNVLNPPKLGLADIYKQLYGGGLA